MSDGPQDRTATGANDDTSSYPNYQDDKEVFRQFIREYVDVDHEEEEEEEEDLDAEPQPLYKKRLQAIKNRTEKSLPIYLSDLIRWDSIRGGDLVSRVMSNAKRYIHVFSEVIDNELEAMVRSSTAGTHSAAENGGHMDAIDVLVEQRVATEASRREQDQQGAEASGPLYAAGAGLMNDPAVVNEQNNNGGVAAINTIPPSLIRRYELQIIPPYAKRKEGKISAAINLAAKAISMAKDNNKMQLDEQGVSLREVRSSSIGQLVTIKGMIVRSSDVKPYCVVATYTCEKCGCEVYQEVKGREFMPQRRCPSAQCNPNSEEGNNVNRGGETLFLQTRGSKFVKFQELKLQEIPSQVPIGHIPRCMPVHVHGELTRSAMPGDIVTIDGVFLPSRVEGGYRSIRAGLIATTYLEATRITVHKKSYDDRVDSNTQADASIVDKVLEVANGEDPVGRLARSIAPEIFGHEDVKRSLLLQLVGGCERKLPDGMRIRGDINICLMGDPGVAKSQLLKYISSLAPRGV